MNLGPSGPVGPRLNSIFIAFLFLFRDIYRRPGIFPIQMQSAGATVLIEADGEIFHGRWSCRSFHIGAGEVFTFAGIGDAPFTSFLANDQSPFVLVRDGEKRIASRRD